MKVERPTHASSQRVRPEAWQDIFCQAVDGVPVQFVRPIDTERPSWCAYEQHTYLGTMHAQHDLQDGTWPLWHVQALAERHPTIEDAVRAIRRPASWSADKEQARRWAADLLADPSLLVLDVQTTGLTDPWAVQIGIVDQDGRTLLNEVVDPRAPIEPAAARLHGICEQRVAQAATFGDLVPSLTDILKDRRCVAYNLAFDRGVLRRELQRHHGAAAAASRSLAGCRWEDAMPPVAAWKGLWSAQRSGYRYQQLGSRYEAIANCRAVLETLQILSSDAMAPWSRYAAPSRS
ncbi:3'-5' exonuclease [Streptomyces sp. N35]|uniref:3'-5' exonuclease n=1 Tax=Streptomyces sp. N35 TaxID=2795730 RepID=UPI0018F76FDC|nr:3'-5' exonuclease [Streptomyces sp. N35]